MKARVTKQRQIILDAINSGLFHPSIEEIYLKAKEKDESIGKATVYRHVHVFVTDDIITEFILSDGIKYYDINTSNHLHLYCIKCHKLFDVFDQDLENKLNLLEQQENFKIRNSNLIIEGICRDCEEK